MQNRVRLPQDLPQALPEPRPAQATGIEPVVRREENAVGLRQRRPPAGGKELWYGVPGADAEGSQASRRRRHSWNGRGSQKEDADGIQPVASEGPSRPIHQNYSSSGVQVQDAADNSFGSETPRAAPIEIEDESSRLDKGKARMTPNRPPLYSTAFFTPDGASPSHLSSPGEVAAVHTPLQSPSLATYHAPEELQAGPSSYFQPSNPVDDDAEYEDYALYFREANTRPSEPSDGHSTSGSSYSVRPGTPADESYDPEDFPLPVPMGNTPPVAEIPGLLEEEEEEDDMPMPALANWTDDDFDELELDDEPEENPMNDPEPALAQGPAVDEVINDPFGDERERGPAGEDVQVADGLNDEDLDAGMDDDMEGALEGACPRLLFNS